MRTTLIIAAAAHVALAAVGQAQPCLPPTPIPDFGKAVIRTTDLGNRIYMLEGMSGTVGGNVAVAVGDDGVIMVDDMFPQMYGKIKAAIAAITPQPVRYVINTHFHRDHTGGNEAFGKDGASIVAHENLKRVLASGSRNGLNCAVVPPAPEIALPKETYKDTMTIRIRGRTAELKHPVDVHTDGDTTIYFADANVLVAGDLVFFFFFNDTATTESYTLSLHDALPISAMPSSTSVTWALISGGTNAASVVSVRDRKSTRLNSSHMSLAYAVFCVKKKAPPRGPGGSCGRSCWPRRPSARRPPWPWPPSPCWPGASRTGRPCPPGRPRSRSRRGCPRG